MKRSIIFLIALCLFLSIIVISEFLYTRNFKEKTNEIIKSCEQNDNFVACAKRLDDIMSKRKFVNRLFYSRNTAKQIESEIEKLKVYANENEISDANAQLKNIKFLYNTLYRFNAKEE